MPVSDMIGFSSFPTEKQKKMSTSSDSSGVEREFEELGVGGANPSRSTKRVRVLSNRHYAQVA